MKRIIVLFCGILLICAMKDDLHKGFNLKIFEKSLACIPKGSFVFYDSSAEANYDAKSKIKERRVEVDSFYISTHEVSNDEYKEFLKDIRNKDTIMYTRMLPDTTVWRGQHSYNEPYVKYYFRHPAFGDYPVVGVTHEQAEAYCRWLTDRYMKEAKRKFKKAEFRLPTLYQWEYAAIGGAEDYADFPWKGVYMRGKDGRLLANFIAVPEACIKREKVSVKDSSGNCKEIYTIAATGNGDFAYPNNMDCADVTTPVISYYPNGYGLYNMAGNVKEYVREKGLTKGGGWKDYGYYLQNWVEQPYDSNQKATDDRGFRFVMEVVK